MPDLIYKPRERVTISGYVENRASTDAQNLSLSIVTEMAGGSSENIYDRTLNIPANGSYPFTATTYASWSEGKVALTGTVSQNASTLVEITDEYDIARPALDVTVASPDVVGKYPFELLVEMKNSGKMDSSVRLIVSSKPGDTIDD